jgi:hypothetical protein
LRCCGVACSVVVLPCCHHVVVLQCCSAFLAVLQCCSVFFVVLQCCSVVVELNQKILDGEPQPVNCNIYSGNTFTILLDLKSYLVLFIINSLELCYGVVVLQSVVLEDLVALTSASQELWLFLHSLWLFQRTGPWERKTMCPQMERVLSRLIMHWLDLDGMEASWGPQLESAKPNGWFRINGWHIRCWHSNNVGSSTTFVVSHGSN